MQKASKEYSGGHFSQKSVKNEKSSRKRLPDDKYCFIATFCQLEKDDVAEIGRKIATKMLDGWFWPAQHAIWV